MPRIAVFDFEVSGLSHVPLNRDLLHVLTRAYPDAEITMHGEAAHIAALSNSGLPHGIRCKDHGTPPRSAQAAMVGEAEADHKLVLGCPADALAPLLSAAGRDLASAYDLFAHYELAEPARWRSRNPLARRRDLFGLLGRRWPTNVRYTVLEPAVLDQLERILNPRNARAVFPHPCQPDPAPSRAVPDTPSIAFLGGTFPGKGFDHFLTAARDNQGRFAFSVIGARFGDYDETDDRLFVQPPSKTKLPREEFNTFVRASDLICLPLDPVRYSYAASGTLLDAAAFAVPVIATETAITLDWQRRYGPFGYLLERPEDIPAFLADLDPARVTEDRDSFRASLMAIAEDRRPDRIAETFRLHEIPR
ncbi:MAG: hypothetical protein V2J26_10790 [Pacificimonas sp.]|jgi:hypothetical protein|nr:hypothetical protein [Pacificimonas sp.]